MKYILVFGCLGLACGFYAASAEPLWARLLLGSIALCWLGVALAYGGLGARAFGKRRDGRLAPWSAPYHLLNALALKGWKRRARENAFDIINERVLLGCQLGHNDEAGLREHDVRAVLDVTCEFTEAPFLRAKNYRSVPVLDTCAPPLELLREGAQFIEENARRNGLRPLRAGTWTKRHLCRGLPAAHPPRAQR